MATIRIQRGNSVRWAEQNPILEAGEPGFETDTGILKIGDGTSRWSDLEAFFPGIPVPEGDGASDAAVLEHINSLSPHPVYDDGPSFLLAYENAKV